MTSAKAGRLGEDLAVRYLQAKGHAVLDRNYWKKWGEIDLVSMGSDALVHFVEVKSVTCENIEAYSGVTVRPEENMHHMKREKLGRVIQSYISEKSVDTWVFDVVCLYIDEQRRMARVVYFPDAVL
jgi:putative endonuclease